MMFMPQLSHSKGGEDGDRATTPGLTAVAVDKGKYSQHAVRWAIDNLLAGASSITLIHVRCKPSSNNGSGTTESGIDATPGESESETTQLFRPYRVFCARKKLNLKEVSLEDTDVSKAIVDYINANQIQNIVVGASNKNAITRKFRNPDVPTSLTKAVPEFCALYVIAKGKPIFVRIAKVPALFSVLPRRQSLTSTDSQQLSDQDGSVRSSTRGSPRDATPPPFVARRFHEGHNHMKTVPRDQPHPNTTSNNMLNESLDPSVRSRRSSVDSHDSFPVALNQYNNRGCVGSMGSLDFGNSFDSSSCSNNSPRSPYSPISGTQGDVEAEMRRLRLELKQTMDMYNAACKEAITATQKAKEIHKWQMEEAQKFEELRQPEEAALRISEIEKEKCKAVTELKALRIAELKEHKRMKAELKAKSEAEEKKKGLGSLGHIRYRKYTIEEIEVATNNFTEAQKIGEGGYGPVYRATLDHTPVAIKVLRSDTAQGRQQFQKEVEVLSCIRHPNMVLLMGACPENGCLVYEYMDNGSLEDKLFQRGSSPPIPWSVRFRIAAEIATGLLFLHQTKPEPLVHRDLKPANILLDRNYTSKISDVGLARLVPPSIADNVMQYHITATAGTFCYIDPEYQQTGMLGIKSDIYSLGIMLLQIITAKPPMGLIYHVERAIETGTLKDMLDPAVADWPVEEALAYANMALKCAELRKKDRPDLGTVILTELNRLRDLGEEYEAKSNSNNFGRGPFACSNTYGYGQAAWSLSQQELANSESNPTSSWKSESDD